jgi:RND family efflux transporter MFP subunit
MKKIFFIVAVCSYALTACHTRTRENSQEKAGHESRDTLFFSEQQQSKIDFAAAWPVMEYFGQVIKTTGQIESSQADETIIPAKTSGTVLFNRNIVEGQAIQAKQELFIVSGSGTAEKNLNVQFIEAQTNYQKADADYKRARELSKDKIISEKEFLEIKSVYETAQAVYDNLYKNFSSDGQRVSSPISGFVKQLFVSNGQYVETGQALVGVSKNQSLLIKADVQLKYASLLPLIVSATIKSSNKQRVYSLSELNGKILSYGKSVTENNYMLPVIFQINNKGDFIPGSFVEIYIKTQSDKPVMTIPDTSITEEQGNYFVYVQLTSNSFEKREVGIGMTDGIKTEILSGLTAGDKIVTKGVVSVKLSQSSKNIDPHAGHAH